MWALRRASNPLKYWGLSVGTYCTCSTKLEILSSYTEGKAGMFESPQVIPDRCLFYHATYVCSKFSIASRSLSSQAGTQSSGEEDNLEDGLSKVDTAAGADASQESIELEEIEDALISESEFSGDDNVVDEPSQNEVELSDTETDSGEKRSPRKIIPSALFKAIIASPGLYVRSVLDKWVEEGKDLGREEISLAMINLRKRRMYERALQLSEWLEANKRFDFVERDYGSRIDLIAKVRGLRKAESYIKKIPESFIGERIYRTLLANCVASGNVKIAEEVFNKMKDQEFPVTSFACNQLLLLYKKIDKKKIADVLLLMEKENLSPSLFTYRLLIDNKGQSNDLTGMDQIVERMKAEGIEPDTHIQAILAKHYASGGLKEKAEIVLKEMEGDHLKENRPACRFLLPLYAELGKADEVDRVWKVCESSPHFEECLAAIEAWGRLNKIEEAEAVFDRMLKTWKQVSSRHYSALLKVYVNHNMLAKGENLVKRMSDTGCRIGPLTWDALVKLYIEAGQVEKAYSALEKAFQQTQIKPMFSSCMAVMDQYAKRGDIYNTERMLLRMRQVGYLARLRPFQALVQAYITAKTPAYGIRERMKADHVFPNKALADKLAQVDAFRKTVDSDLLD